MEINDFSSLFRLIHKESQDYLQNLYENLENF